MAEQLRALDLGWRCIALEPEGRNTAPAIALAAQLASAEPDGAQLLVLPADHRIEDAAGFAAAVRTAQSASEGGAVVTFGVSPSRAETGYGYIELAAAGQTGVQPVQAFVEKPDAERARAFMASGRHLWNSGMFLVDAAVALAEIEAHSPDMAAAVAESVRTGKSDLDFFRPSDAFLRSPNLSFDVAVMDLTARAAVLPVDFGWSDIGSWESVLETAGADGRGERYQAKRIKVKPGASISLQLHRHRAEHWVVVRGVAEVTCGEETFTLSENQSTYIPQGTKHRLRNPGDQTLEIIEVQVGDYLGEDDIVRFDDQYGRETG